MHRIDARLLVTVLAITAAGFASQAQTAPPIKPGLWQIHSEREVNGQKQPDASERMKNMTPEKRAQIEAMMKQHGVGSGAAGMGQVCYTRETLERSPWADQQTTCKTVFSSRSAATWKWHTSCPASRYEADGEAVFLRPRELHAEIYLGLKDWRPGSQLSNDDCCQMAGLRLRWSEASGSQAMTLATET